MMDKRLPTPDNTVQYDVAGESGFEGFDDLREVAGQGRSWRDCNRAHPAMTTTRPRLVD